MIARQPTAAIRWSASAGFHEPSLVFLVGTRTRLVDGASAAEILRRANAGLRSSKLAQERAFAQRAERIGLRYSLRAPAREQLQHQWRAAGHPSRSTARSRSSEHEHRQTCAPGPSAAPHRRASSSAGSRWSAVRGDSRRAACCRRPAARARRACRHRARRRSRCCCSTRAASTFAARAAALAGRHLQRDDRLRPVRLVPRSARLADIVRGRILARRSRGASPISCSPASWCAATICFWRSRCPVCSSRWSRAHRPHAALRARPVHLFAMVVAAQIREPAVRAPCGGLRARGCGRARCGRGRAFRSGSSRR